MKIVVCEFKKISPYSALFEALNEDGKMILKEMGKKHFNSADLYFMHKLGCEIIYKKHTQK